MRGNTIRGSYKVSSSDIDRRIDFSIGKVHPKVVEHKSDDRSGVMVAWEGPWIWLKELGEHHLKFFAWYSPITHGVDKCFRQMSVREPH